MLIRRPAGEVFRAFVEPEMLTRFWLEHASAPLAKGAEVTWAFLVPGAVATLKVTAFEPSRRIAFDWPDGIKVEITFEAGPRNSTKVSVKSTGFQGKDGEAAVVDTTEGFTIVLCDLKTLLESGKSAGLVKDKAELIVMSAKE